MGFLDRLRASQSLPQDWKELTEENQLEAIDKVSEQKPVILFKHSTSCGISAGAKHRLESNWEVIPSGVDFYYLDLLRHRNISNAISERYGVRHESPQVLVIKSGKATYHSSHHRIVASAIGDQVS